MTTALRMGLRRRGSGGHPGTRIGAAEIRGRLIRNWLEAVDGRVALEYVMSDQRMQVA